MILRTQAQKINPMTFMLCWCVCHFNLLDPMDSMSNLYLVQTAVKLYTAHSTNRMLRELHITNL